MPDSNGAENPEAEISEADKIDTDGEAGDMSDPDEYGSLTVEDPGGPEDGEADRPGDPAAH